MAIVDLRGAVAQGTAEGALDGLAGAAIKLALRQVGDVIVRHTAILD